MKIDRDKKEWSSFSSVGGPASREIRRRASSGFEQELSHQRQNDEQYRMQEILKQLDGVAERLKRSLSINDLMLYKRLVKDFLQEATSRAYSLRQDQGRSRRGRALLVTIQTVDQEIGEILEQFTRQKTEPLEVLTALDKIRGMLLDLMV